jgi:hypothetical protein
MKDTPKDIIDVLIPPKVDDEDEETEMLETEYEEKYVPEHPYCTNWPVSKKEKNENV